MARLRVHCIGMSIDGFSAGPDQSLEHPLGVGAMALFEWFFPTDAFQRMHGTSSGETGIDNDFAARGVENVGAYVLGRNMFGPVRGPWPDESWKGWWGPNPPYHCPVFVLTHHPRPTLEMEGGTTFTFVTEGLQEALSRAFAAANGKDVRIGGGVSTIRQALALGLVDELHLAVSPVLLGRGEHLLGGLDLPKLGFRCVEHVASARATHVVFARGGSASG
jgi:dihydrofolate reductase